MQASIVTTAPAPHRFWLVAALGAPGIRQQRRYRATTFPFQRVAQDFVDQSGFTAPVGDVSGAEQG